MNSENSPNNRDPEAPPVIGPEAAPPVINPPGRPEPSARSDRKILMTVLIAVGVLLATVIGVSLLFVRHAQIRRARALQVERAAAVQAARAAAEARQAPNTQPMPTSLTGRSPSEWVSQGNAYGSVGDWRRAFECFRQVIAAGSVREWDWSWASAAALVVGETNTAWEFSRGLMERFGQVNDPAVAERCAKQCLCLPGLSGELLEKALDRAEFAVSANPDDRWCHLVKAMAEYRRGNGSNALEWLRRPEMSGNIEVSSLGWSLGAMARHQLGDVAGARMALEEVNRRLKVMAGTGQLAASRNNTWDNFARAVAVRAEAERLIHGREISAPVSPEAVSEGARRWQTILRFVNLGEQLAAQGQWTQASDAFAKATEQPGFDWDIYELRQSILVQEMAVVFVLAGEMGRHRALCETLLARKNHFLPLVTIERYASVYFIQTKDFPSDLKTQALAWARRLAQTEGADRSSWCWLARGMAEYRQGQFAEALVSLEQAEASTDVYARARARAFWGMASARLGRVQEAREALQEVEKALGPDALQNFGWWGRGFCRIAFEELKTLVATEGKPPPAR